MLKYLTYYTMFIKTQERDCCLVASAQDIQLMQYALTLAKRAETIGEIPVGAVLVDSKGNIIGEGWNQVIALSDPSAHAEILAIRQASHRLQNYRLLDCTLYVTLEPCTMCAGAILHSRLSRLVFGASDYKTGAIGSRFHLFEDYKMNHLLTVQGGVLKEACSKQISEFFQRRRIEKKQQKQAV
ncbi:tRNA adenosine(34) deaminase TadA [[Haemophilus] ducreyi]|nr:tRNA adenosine(34) deaminase TadA [[Haemophilus] ducreyi]SEV87114.1 tRNA-adenosine deaminase [[Haemophilus] ducreyi]VEG83498.1 tRNA-adenosine deaminase [[Haemophilus] ducreyi]